MDVNRSHPALTAALPPTAVPAVSWWAENRRTLALAAPMMAGQLGQMLMGLTDSVMVGHLGTLPLAVAGLALNVINVPLVFGFGLVAGVATLTSQAHGAGRERDAVETLRHGLGLGAGAGLALAGLAGAWAWAGGLGAVGQPAEVAGAARGFFLILAASLPGALVWQVLKSWCEARSRPWVPFWLTAGAVGSNVLLNWVFIHGRLGVPALGMEGSAWATFAARTGLALALLGYVRWSGATGLTGDPSEERRGGWDAGRWCALLRVGLPVGATLTCEVGLFAGAALMMGTLGATALAAHQIAITCAATTFMLPLGLSMAVGVRLGQAVGSGAGRETRQAIGFGGLALGTGVMAACASGFLLAGRVLARGFVGDAPGEEPTVALAAGLLAIAGVFQVFDGAQVVGMGALRGLGDVRVPTLVALAAYWAVALPACWALGFPLGGGPRGVWVGLALGLAVAAGALLWRLRWRLGR